MSQEMMARKRLVMMARGEVKADLVLKHCRIVNVLPERSIMVTLQ